MTPAAVADDSDTPPTTVPAALLRAIDLPPRYAAAVLQHALGDPWTAMIPIALWPAGLLFGVQVILQAVPAGRFPATSMNVAYGIVGLGYVVALWRTLKRIAALEGGSLLWQERVFLAFRPGDAVVLPTAEIAVWVDAALEHLGLPCATFAKGTRPTDGAVADALIRVAEDRPCITALDQGSARLARRLAASLATLPADARWSARATAYLLLFDTPENHAATDPEALRQADPALVKRDVALLHTILGQCFTPHMLPHTLRMYQPLLTHHAHDAAAQSL